MRDKITESCDLKDERQTENLMCQAMSEHMNQKGVHMSPEEIQCAIDTQTNSENPPEQSEKETETLGAMGEHQKQILKQNPVYVVRGALLYCVCGSHCRRLILISNKKVDKTIRICYNKYG